jgi:hypothetical protein
MFYIQQGECAKLHQLDWIITEFEPFLLVNIAHDAFTNTSFGILKHANIPSESRMKIDKNILKVYL